jgi:hypothetical protein
MTSCSGASATPAATSLPTATALPSSTPTIKPSPTPTATLTPKALPGIGVTRQKIQAAYEKLSLTFDNPTIENGVQNVVGHIVLADFTGVGVFLVGKDENLQEASVNILIPKMLLLTPKSSAKQHGKVLFVMQVLMDEIFPEWKESSVWLDESLRSFDGKEGKKATVETTQGQNIIIFDVELLTDKKLSDYMSVSLTIRPK